MEQSSIKWNDYIKYKAALRGFDLSIIENTLLYTDERYFDTATDRIIAIGRYNKELVMIPYEVEGNYILPITIHATTRQQINYRIETGRFVI